MKNSLRWYIGLLALIAINMLACGDSNQQTPQPVRVKVSIIGITSEVDALRANVSLDDQPRPGSPRTYPNNNSVLWVELPAQTMGRLSVSIDALQGGCKIETAKSDISLLGDSYYEMTLMLNLLPDKLCTLTILKTGAGFVSTDIPGIDCGVSCTAEYQLGTSVLITARPDVPTFPPTWSSMCKGSSSVCSVKVNGPTVVSINFLPKVCTETGWCWENPIPQGNYLYSVWVAANQTAFAVGASGTAIQWNGYGWLGLPTGLSTDLSDVWGLNPSDVWAVGDKGIALHWKGSSWSATPTNTTSTLRGVWGSATNDVWAVGDPNTIIHWDGSNWTPMLTAAQDLKSIWGTSSTDVWAVAASTITNGSVLHWNGTKWLDVTPPGPLDNYYSVWGSGPNDILVAGIKTVYRWNGTQWNILNVPLAQNTIGVLWGTGANNIYLIVDGNKILRWQGTAWTLAYSSPGGNFSRIRGSGSNDIWAIGEGGLSAHWDGTGWTQNGSNLVSQGGSITLNAGCGTSPDDGWIVGSKGSVFRWNGSALQRISNIPTSNNLNAVWCAPPSIPGTPTDSVWAVGANGTIILWNGSEWTAVQSAGTSSLVSVVGNTSTDVWMTGNSGTVLHWDGTKLSQIPTSTMVSYDLAAVQGTRLYAAQASSTYVDTYDGKSWSTLPSAQPCSIDTLAIAGNSFFMAGSVNGKMSPGCIRHYNGTIWLDDANPTSLVLRLAARSASDVWGVTADSVIQYDGVAWRTVDTRTSLRLTSIFTSGPSDVFVLGVAGAVLHAHQ